MLNNYKGKRIRQTGRLFFSLSLRLFY